LYGPQLTPAGRLFQMSAFVMSIFGASLFFPARAIMGRLT
jgi:hypothetical protein